MLEFQALSSTLVRYQESSWYKLFFGLSGRPEAAASELKLAPPDALSCFSPAVGAAAAVAG